MDAKDRIIERAILSNRRRSLRAARHFARSGSGADSEGTSDDEVRNRKLTPTDDFEIVQHVELLDMPIHVTEHRLHKYLTPDGKTVVTRVPELEGRPIFGPRMLAMIGWLKSRAHCSYTTIARWMG